MTTGKAKQSKRFEQIFELRKRNIGRMPM